jgi:hypothetical protein
MGGETCHTGISRKTATAPSSPCMNATTLRTNMQTGACAICSRGQGKRLSCEPALEMQDLFGAISFATEASQGSTARSSAMRARSYRVSLSDKLTLSLMRSGLVAGITPTSIRKRCGAAIPDTVLWSLAGSDAA